MPATSDPIHFHAGHNIPGYLPMDDDPYSFESFDSAKRSTIEDLDSAGDSIQSWADEHDCDDVPCPTYGDECPWQIASTYSAVMEDLNLENGPGWSATLPISGSPHDLGVVYWIVSCSEDCLIEETDEGDEGQDHESYTDAQDHESYTVSFDGERGR